VWALVLMSVGPICLYLIIWLGWIKSWYILVPLPGKFSSSAVYALLPIGLAFSMLMIAAMFFPTEARTKLDVWSVLFLLLGGVGLVFIFWCPRWLKPPWVRWLEREYGYCLDVLIDEARKVNRWEWESAVQTREGMQSWVDGVFLQRRMDIDRCWEEERKRLLWKQARAERRYWLGWGEEIKGFVPEHRQEEEKERARKEKRRAKRRR
jgi:hypothetical protein